MSQFMSQQKTLKTKHPEGPYLLHVGGEPGWGSFVFFFGPLHFFHDHLIKRERDDHYHIITSHHSTWAAVCCLLTTPCSGTAAWTLRLTTWAKAGQCCGGLKPLLGSVPLVLVVGTLADWPRVSYTFMCSLFPCRAALWRTRKHESHTVFRILLKCQHCYECERS